MNNKITFPDLINLVATATDTSKRISEVFLKEYFSTIAQELVSGESVSVNGLGSFSITNVNPRKSIDVNTGEEIEIPSHRKIVFTPAKSIAELINAPFAEFESIMLDDDFSEADFDQAEETAAISSDLMQQKIGNNPFDDAIANEETSTPIIEEKPTITPPPFTKKKAIAKPEPQIPPIAKTEVTNECESTLPENKEIEYASDFFKEDNSWWQEYKGVILSLLAFVIILAGAISGWYYYCANKFTIATEPQQEETAEASTVAAAASDSVVANADSISKKSDSLSPSKPIEKDMAKTVVTDTVTRSVFLTKLSRKHYGDYHFWVYIYEENKDKISNPNAVSPGTVVIIPDAAKYGIDKNNPQSITKAQQKANEILKK